MYLTGLGMGSQNRPLNTQPCVCVGGWGKLNQGEVVQRAPYCKCTQGKRDGNAAPNYALGLETGSETIGTCTLCAFSLLICSAVAHPESETNTFLNKKKGRRESVPGAVEFFPWGRVCFLGVFSEN